MMKSGREQLWKSCLCGATKICIPISNGQAKKHGVSWTLTPRSHQLILLLIIDMMKKLLRAQYTTQMERLKHLWVLIQAQAKLSKILITTQSTLILPLQLQLEQSEQLVIWAEQNNLDLWTQIKILSPSIILSIVEMEEKRSKSLRMKKLLVCMVTTRKVKRSETLASLSR